MNRADGAKTPSSLLLGEAGQESWPVWESETNLGELVLSFYLLMVPRDGTQVANLVEFFQERRNHKALGITEAAGRRGEGTHT